jgi:Mg2+ and Co2+ transporter CorA
MDDDALDLWNRKQDALRYDLINAAIDQASVIIARIQTEIVALSQHVTGFESDPSLKEG